MNRKQLSGMLGMYEMEEAVEHMLQICEKEGKPFHEMLWSAGQFCIPTQLSSLLVGFCQLLCWKWLLPGYPNSQFYPSNGLIDRMKEHGILDKDTPYALSPVDRCTRMIKKATSEFEKRLEEHK